MEEYNSSWPYFDKIGRVQHLAGKTFQHEDAIKDHWMNATNDYDVHIRDYCRMNLYLVERALKIKISLKSVQQDIEEMLDPFFNRDRIGDRPIMNVVVDKEENVVIKYRARHVIKLT